VKILNTWITQKRWFRSIAFTICVFAVVFIAQHSVDTLRTMEFTALNQAYAKRTNLEVNPDVAFWNMTDDDIKMLRWPWGWDRFAQMVKTLQLYGVKCAMIQEDVFSNAGHTTLSQEDTDKKIESLSEKLEDKALLKSELQRIASDSSASMAAAMKDWPQLMLSQGFLIPDHQELSDILKRTEEQKKGFLAEKKQNIISIQQQAFDLPLAAKNILGAININPLHPQLIPHVKTTGFMRLLPDEDGVIRQAPTCVQYDGKLFYSQPVVAAAEYLGVPLTDLEMQPGRLVFHGRQNPRTGKELAIPVDAMGKMYVNWTAKVQLEDFDSAPFGPVKQLITWDMFKTMAKGKVFNNNDVIGQYLQDTHSMISTFGWQDAEYIQTIGIMLITCSRIEFDILNGNEWAGTVSKYGRLAEDFDLDLFHQSIYLNNILKANWDEKTPAMTFDTLLSNPDQPIYADRVLLPYLEKDLLKAPEDLELLTEAEFITQDESFEGEVVRVIIKHLDWSKTKWLSEMVIKTNQSQAVLKDKFESFYDRMIARKDFLRNGYEQTLFHLQTHTLEQVEPLYFQAPVKFTDNKKRNRTVRLMDYKDKIVFIGLTATGLNALNPTPYVGRYPMASLTPTAFNTITTGAFIRRLDWVGPVAILVYAFLTFVFVFYFPAYVSLPLTLGLAAGHYFSGLALLDHQGLIIPLISPLLGTLAAYLSANLYIYIEQQRERQKIRGMFAAMVSPEVLKIMEDEPDKFNLRGEKVEASMFSSDVSGFTSISEGVTAQELALILNLYLTPMSNLVMTYGGYVEKYEGDAIKADFGMPLPDPDHAWKACFSSLLQQEELQVVQRMLQLKYGVMITARMGVNTGVVNAGNMGSINKMQYCAIGEEVAMAEELEPSNKMWETWIAISPESLRLSGDRLETRLLDIVEYPHVTIPVYELLGWRKEVFLKFWEGKPIPKLVIEGWERIIPEKILAYIDYYHRRVFKGNGFYELMISSLEALEAPCLEFMKLNDNIEIYGLEKRYLAQLANIDAQGIKVTLEELDLVDRRELEGLMKARDNAKEDWLKILNGYLVELKLRTHAVNRFGDRMPQTDIDELLTAIDTLEKNCNCYIKRNKFPSANDRYGQDLRQHLVSVLPNPSQGLSDEQVEKMKLELKALAEKIKQAIHQFIVKAKTMAPDYHVMMAEHGVLSQTKREVCEIFAKGRELYLKRQWDEAIALFKQGLAMVPDDGPCMKFIDRCEKFKKSPPEDDWKGVWIADW
jgi:class 3 adenylate cyclase